MIVAAVPVKDLGAAKQRLARALDAPARADLVRAMLRDVLRALAAAPLDAVWVVTRDADVEAIARAHGAAVVQEAANHGHTAAVALAQARATAAGARTFLTVPGDVPGTTPAEIAALLDAGRAEGPAAAFCPSRSGRGTNGAALSPPDVMPLTFGEPSFDNHVAAARARGLVVRIVRLPGLALDIDDPGDLRALLDQAPATATARLLARRGGGDRGPAAARRGR